MGMSYQIHHGDCLEALRNMLDSSVDSIVTDPPYGLSFMGKKWDYDVPGTDVWAECLRVLKPGGHLLAFAGTRTQHRMAVRIEDAGFEIRDMIAWVYGSGYPKSMNVAKAIDARIAAGDGPEPKQPEDYSTELTEDEALFCAWMRDHSGLSAQIVKSVTGSDRFLTGKVVITNTATKENPRYGRRSMVPTAAAWVKLREHITEAPPEWLEELVKNPPQEPDETPGEAWTKGKGVGTQGRNEWAGWGTALKPALEPITVARKPLSEKTIAANVLLHGTGALNIDGCRVGDFQNTTPSGVDRRNASLAEAGYRPGTYQMGDKTPDTPPGRWPANLIHDGSDEVVAGFPQAKGQQGSVTGDEPSSKTNAVYGQFNGRPATMPRGDTGSAARFFYCAKASRSDRNEGLPSSTTPAVATEATMREREDADWSARNGNHHPTVKPTDLMAYLCRLVTPPGGTVLDPFMGSGSTGKAAMREGFNFIGCEQDARFVEIAKARIEFEQRAGHQIGLVLEAA